MSGLSYRDAAKHLDKNILSKNPHVTFIGDGTFHFVYRFGEDRAIKYEKDNETSQSQQSGYNTLTSSLLCEYTLTTSQQVDLFKAIYPPHAERCRSIQTSFRLDSMEYTIYGMEQPYFPEEANDRMSAAANLAMFKRFGVFIPDPLNNFRKETISEDGVCIDFDHALCARSAPLERLCPNAHRRWEEFKEDYNGLGMYWDRAYPFAQISISVARSLAAIMETGIRHADVPESLLTIDALVRFDRSHLGSGTWYHPRVMQQYLMAHSAIAQELARHSETLQLPFEIYQKYLGYKYGIPALRGFLQVLHHLDFEALSRRNAALAKSVSYKPEIFYILGAASHLSDFPSLCTEEQLHRCDTMSILTLRAIADFIHRCEPEQITVARIQTLFHHPMPLAQNFINHTNWSVLPRASILHLLDNRTDAPRFARNAAFFFICRSNIAAIQSCDAHDKPTKRKVIRCVEAECERQRSDINGLRRAFTILVWVMSHATKFYRGRQCNYREPNEFQAAKPMLQDAASVLFTEQFPFFEITRCSADKIHQLREYLFPYRFFEAHVAREEGIWQNSLPEGPGDDDEPTLFRC